MLSLGGTSLACRNYFFKSTASAGYFLEEFKSPARLFFLWWGVGGRGVRGVRDILLSQS